MHVEDRVGIRIEYLAAQDAVVPGTDDERDTRVAHALHDGAVAQLGVATKDGLWHRQRRNPVSLRDVERRCSAAIADHKRHAGREIRSLACAQQGFEVRARSRYEHTDCASRLAQSRRTRAALPARTTRPMTLTSTPATLCTASAAGGATLAPLPIPLLDVRHISSGCTPPAVCSASKMPGGAHESRAISAARPSGRTRGMLSMRPPPVMWASACTSATCISSRTGARYERCDASSRSASGASVPGSTSFQLNSRSATMCRTSEYPLVCSPLLGRPRITSPSATPLPSRILRRSTAPTMNPAMS